MSEQITVSVVGDDTSATITSGAQINVTLGDVGPITWTAITGKPSTFAPQAHTHAIADTVGLEDALDDKADLDSNGKVPSSQLPSYVDDVLEYANLAAFPGTGETGKIYLAIDTKTIYRWTGSVYLEISPSAVTSVAGKTGAVTLVKADVGLGNVDNTSDANKPVSSATQTALNGKVDTSDSRLTDARTPTSHVHGNVTNAGAIGTTSGLPIKTGTAGVLEAGAFGSTGGTFCEGNDSRLSDSRTPTSHTHGNITNAGAIGTTANVPVITGASGVLAAGSFGTAANTFCAGDDARLSNSRTPTSHASTHHTGGTDAITPANIGAALAPVASITTADQTVTGTTLTDATNMSFSAAANATYLVSMLLVAYDDGGGDFDAKIVVPAGASALGYWDEVNSLNFGTTEVLLSDRYSIVFASEDLLFGFRQTFIVKTDSTSGTVKLQFARRSTAGGGTAAVLKAGSWISAQRIS